MKPLPSVIAGYEGLVGPGATLPTLVFPVFGAANCPVRAAELSVAAFCEELIVQGTLQLGSGNDLPVRLTASESIDERGSMEEFAKTTSGLLPSAGIALHLTGYDPCGTNCRSVAVTGYSLRVEQVAGEPFFGQVPVNLPASGRASWTAQVNVEIGYLFAKTTMNFAGSVCVFEADLTSAQGVLSFDQTFREFVGVGIVNQVGLTAWGETQIWPA